MIIVLVRFARLAKNVLGLLCLLSDRLSLRSKINEVNLVLFQNRVHHLSQCILQLYVVDRLYLHRHAFPLPTLHIGLLYLLR